jgi:hypothetical protein
LPVIGPGTPLTVTVLVIGPQDVAYDTVAVPAAIPVTVPVGLTVATPVGVMLQGPPGLAVLSDIVPPIHKLVGPVMGETVGDVASMLMWYATPLPTPLQYTAKEVMPEHNDITRSPAL